MLLIPKRESAAQHEALADERDVLAQRVFWDGFVRKGTLRLQCCPSAIRSSQKLPQLRQLGERSLARDREGLLGLIGLLLVLREGLDCVRGQLL